MYKNTYRQVLTGFERYSFTEDELAHVKHDLAWALEDLVSCANCEGKICKTVINKREFKKYGSDVIYISYKEKSRYYYALHHGDCDDCKKPKFRVFKCPGPLNRKVQIKDSMTSKRTA